MKTRNSKKRAERREWAEAEKARRARQRALAAQEETRRAAMLKKALVKDLDPLRALQMMRAGGSYTEVGRGNGWIAGLFPSTAWPRAGKPSEEFLDKFEALLTLVRKKASNLLDDRAYQDALVTLARQTWVADLSKWKSKGRSRETRFRSLAGHLLAKYPVPLFLYNVFTLPVATERENGIKLFCFLGQGGSVKKALGTTMLPTTMTKRMCHLFLGVRSTRTLPQAVREAQIIALGGDSRLVDAVNDTFLGREFRPDEEFWLSTIQWFCNQDMLDPAQVAPLIDYITHRKQQDATFEMKGRTALSLTRDMEDWHVEINRQKKLGNYVYTPSGFHEGIYEFKRGDEMDIWTVEEVLTSKDLAREGRALHHCVYTYGSSVVAGRTSIWSLRRNGERLLTIEVTNQNRAIVQVRGLLNRLAKAHERKVLSRWADENRLSMRST